ncbi:hypothetical protein [Anaeromicrobium sediminis]|nr:hypothetical protein [Anaeromicrobium sediminis]
MADKNCIDSFMCPTDLLFFFLLLVILYKMPFCGYEPYCGY